MDFLFPIIWKRVFVTIYAEAFLSVQSDSQASEWYSYFENNVSAQ